MGSIFILSPYFLYSQYNSKLKEQVISPNRFSVSAYGTFVSSAELQDNIKSPLTFIRNASVELKGGYGYGAEINFNPEIKNFDILFYLSSEYLSIKDDELVLSFQQDTLNANVKFTENISMVPVEGGIKWNLPVSTNNFKIYIGGGAGIYFGNRTRNIGSLTTVTLSSKPGYSMNVLAGSDFYISRNLSVNFEFKFREAYFENEADYTTEQVMINGNFFTLENPIYSRIIIDGVRISGGLKFHF